MKVTLWHTINLCHYSHPVQSAQSQVARCRILHALRLYTEELRAYLRVVK